MSIPNLKPDIYRLIGKELMSVGTDCGRPIDSETRNAQKNMMNLLMASKV